MQRARLGIIYPDDGDADADFYELTPRDVNLYITRNAGWSPTYSPKSFTSVEGLKTHFTEGHLKEAALRLAPIGPDVLAYACLSCSFVGGPGYDGEIARLLSEVGGCPATTATTALLAALKTMDIQRVAVVSSYDDDRNRVFEKVLAAADVMCVNLCSVKIPPEVREFYESVGLPGPSQIRSPELAYRLGMRTNRSEAQAVVIGSTNFRTAPIIDTLERDLAKPVLTANQVVIWHALELCGVHVGDGAGGSLFGFRLAK